MDPSPSDYRHPGAQLHPAPAVFEDSVYFRPEALRYGINFPNLTWLKVLARLDGFTGQAQRECPSFQLGCLAAA